VEVEPEAIVSLVPIRTVLPVAGEGGTHEAASGRTWNRVTRPVIPGRNGMLFADLGQFQEARAEIEIGKKNGPRNKCSWGEAIWN
jgi:hypothetical protein